MQGSSCSRLPIAGLQALLNLMYKPDSEVQLAQVKCQCCSKLVLGATTAVQALAMPEAGGQRMHDANAVPALSCVRAHGSRLSIGAYA